MSITTGSVHCPPATPQPGARYIMNASGPPPAHEEVELRHVLTAEILIYWAGDLLHVSHVRLPGSFRLGEDSQEGACDFFLPASKLGCKSQVVCLGYRNRVYAVLPQGGTGQLSLPDGSTLPLTEAYRVARDSGQRGHNENAAPSGFVPLAAGVRAQLFFGDVEVQIAPVRAGRPVASGWRQAVDPNVLAYLGLSALSVGGLLSGMAFWMPPLGLTRDEDVSADNLYLIQQYLAASAARSMEQLSTSQGDLAANAGDESRQDAKPAASAQGVASNQPGAPRSVGGNSRERERSVADTISDTGMLALLDELVGTQSAGTPGFELNADALAAQVEGSGLAFDAVLGEVGGMGLSSWGDGTGGPGAGVGMNGIRTGGTASGGPNGLPGGLRTGLRTGLSTGRSTGRHATRVPQLRPVETQVSGRIPEGTILRIVQLQRGRFRSCYERALQTNPSLQGRAVVRFTINRDGSVGHVDTGTSDVPSPKLLRCIKSVFYGLSFPKPDGGLVTVRYPILLQPE